MLKHSPCKWWEILTRKQASAAAPRPSFCKVMHVLSVYAHPFPSRLCSRFLWPAVFPSKGLTICTVLRKAMSDSLPQTTAFHQSPWLQSPVEEDNIQIAFHAITYPRQRQQIQTGCLVTCAVAGEPPSAGSCTILICLCKLLWDGCHRWKNFLMSKANKWAKDKSSHWFSCAKQGFELGPSPPMWPRQT